jgi:ATP-binding cassette, subfamily B, bacterial
MAQSSPPQTQPPSGFWGISATVRDSLGKRFVALRNLPRLFAMIWRTSRPLTAASVALRLVRAGLPALMLYVGKLIVDEVVRLAQHSLTNSSATTSIPHLFVNPSADGAFSVFSSIFSSVVSSASNTPNLFAPLLLLVALELALALASDVLARCTALCDSLLGDLFANKTSVDLMRHAATLDLAMFEDATFYDKLEKARRQTTSRIALMTQTLAQVYDLVSMSLLALGLAAFAPWLLVLLVLAVIPSFVGESRFNARSYSLLNSWTPQRRELDYLRFTGASDDTAKEVKMFGLADFLTARYEALSNQYYRENRVLALQRAAWGSALAAVGTLGYYGAYGFILLQTARGAISLGDMTFLAGAFRGMRSSLEAVLGRFASIAESALYLQDLFDFFAMKPRIERLHEHTGDNISQTDTTPASRTNSAAARRWLPFPRPVREGFVFDNVGFRYDASGSASGGSDDTASTAVATTATSQQRWALRGVSFTLNAGEKIALVGENGAGKTTLVKLLARLYDPSEGAILLDGRDLRDYDPVELRSEIGVIFQDFVRYQLNAGTNIAVGRIAEQANTGRIDHAAAQSLADSVIQSLPNGYDQLIGRRFAGGVELSGGQWQKIALARAYMRDAQVLILDEPTAALDARAEYEIFQRFTDLTRGKSAVLISHRFSTVRMADRILVLGNGTLLESGSHDELLALDGRYAELFRLQAKGYL